MSKQQFKQERQFGLLEVMMVVAILAILAVVATPAIIKYMRKQKTEATLEKIDEIYRPSYSNTPVLTEPEVVEQDTDPKWEAHMEELRAKHAEVLAGASNRYDFGVGEMVLGSGEPFGRIGDGSGGMFLALRHPAMHNDPTMLPGGEPSRFGTLDIWAVREMLRANEGPVDMDVLAIVHGVDMRPLTSLDDSYFSDIETQLGVGVVRVNNMLFEGDFCTPLHCDSDDVCPDLWMCSPMEEECTPRICELVECGQSPDGTLCGNCPDDLYCCMGECLSEEEMTLTHGMPW